MCGSQCGDVDSERRFGGTVRPMVVVLAEKKAEYYYPRPCDADDVPPEDNRPSERAGVDLGPSGSR